MPRTSASSPATGQAVQGQTAAQPEGTVLNLVNWVGNVISPVGAALAVVMAVVSYAPAMLPLDSESTRLIEDAINTDQVLVFGQRPESLRSRRRQRTAVPEQPSLFGLIP